MAETALPPTPRLTILRCLSVLPEDALQVLQVAAILGSAFSLTDLVFVTDRPAVSKGAYPSQMIKDPTAVTGDQVLYLLLHE